MITSIASGGREIVLGLRGPGEVIGDLSALDGAPRSATALAVGEVEATVAPGAALTRALTEIATAMELLRLLANRLRDADRKRLEFAALGHARARRVAAGGAQRTLRRTHPRRDRDRTSPLPGAACELVRRIARGDRQSAGGAAHAGLHRHRPAQRADSRHRGAPPARLRLPCSDPSLAPDHCVKRRTTTASTGVGGTSRAARQYRHQPERPNSRPDRETKPQSGASRSKPMSPQLHYETAHTPQHETRRPGPSSPRRDHRCSFAARSGLALGRAVAALGVCLAAATAVTVTGAHASSHRYAGVADESRDPRIRGQGLRAGRVHTPRDADAQCAHRSVRDRTVVVQAKRRRCHPGTLLIADAAAADWTAANRG